MLKEFLCCTFVLGVMIDGIEMIATERSATDEYDVKDHQQLLSRRRRYLAFPEGSSLQLGKFSSGRHQSNSPSEYFLIISIVYDQIIGMVDSTNLHIFGITVALAWQLPDKSMFTEEQTEAPLHDTKISVSEIVNKTDKADVIEPSANKNHRHYDTYYNRKNYHAYNLNDKYYNYLKTKQTFYRPPLNKQSQFDDWRKYQTNKIRWNYSHNTYPALRMRRQVANHNESLNGTSIHPEVKHSLIHHRNTRFDLYQSIEKYLNA